jgi:hypothetical protein
MHEVKLKVKLSQYRHGQSLRAEVEAPRIFRQRMKVVRLSALCAGHLYPPGDIPGTHFC